MHLEHPRTKKPYCKAVLPNGKPGPTVGLEERHRVTCRSCLGTLAAARALSQGRLVTKPKDEVYEIDLNAPVTYKCQLCKKPRTVTQALCDACEAAPPPENVIRFPGAP